MPLRGIGAVNQLSMLMAWMGVSVLSSRFLVIFTNTDHVGERLTLNYFL